MAAAVWLTAAHIAGLSTPGLPKTDRGVRNLASRDGWERRRRCSQGGGWEYPLDGLPVEIREAYEVNRFLQSSGITTPNVSFPDDPATPPPIGRTIPSLPAAIPTAQAARRTPGVAGALRREARLLILSVYDAFRVTTGLRKTRAITLFCEAYNAGSNTGHTEQIGIGVTGRRTLLDVPSWVLELRPSVSPNSLRSWDNERRSGKCLPLAGQYGCRADTGRIDRCDKLREFLIGGMLHNPDMSASQLRKAAEECIGETIQIVDFHGATKDPPSQTSGPSSDGAPHGWRLIASWSR